MDIRILRHSEHANMLLVSRIGETTKFVVYDSSEKQDAFWIVNLKDSEEWDTEDERTKKDVYNKYNWFGVLELPRYILLDADFGTVEEWKISFSKKSMQLQCFYLPMAYKLWQEEIPQYTYSIAAPTNWWADQDNYWMEKLPNDDVIWVSPVRELFLVSILKG